MRRQNRSCDQCRKAKRACDASPLADTQRGRSTVTPCIGRVGTLDGDLTGRQTKPCTYCIKTKKNCTFNWAQSQLQSGSASSRSVHIDNQKSSRSRHGRHVNLQPRQPLTAAQLDVNSQPFSDLLSTPPEDNGPWDLFVPSFDVSVLQGGAFENTFPQGMSLESGRYGAESPEEQANEMTHDSRSFLGMDNSSLIHPASYHAPPDNGPNYPISPDWTFGRAKSTAVESASSQQPHMIPGAPKPSYYTSHKSGTSMPPLSVFSAEHSMMERANGGAISSNLLRIYHDVLEYSLSCWLTEDTCPYKLRPLNGVSPRPTLRPQPTPTIEGGSDSTQQEWEPAWSNRIYRRVIKLDRVAQSTKLITLTCSEDRAASKALRLAIMAFATQWAQRSHRAEERYGQFFDAGDLGSDTAEEFDRSLQRSLWEQARKALQDSADLETFKIVCAEVIFGWTQKPWDEHDAPAERNQDIGDAQTIRASLGPQLEELISKDGLPVFLERAARKMRALKFKFDAHEVGLDSARGGISTPNGARGADALDSEDRETVGLLYWLAVMADTISSSMHERPVVLADEDCQHDGTYDRTPGNYADGGNKLNTQRWWVELFIQDNPTSPLQSIRLPCSPEEAATAVQKSAPVKVLLYRHVSYLQNALRGRSRGQPVEDIIRSATLVYRYWNVTYGVFFRDLIENYDSVPPRVRGWFVCIHAHWHLAVLMLADLIEFVDDNGLGTQSASQSRSATLMLERIRSSSADELSDLSRVSTPAQVHESADGPPQMPDFHFAVNTGTILTEPWTIILIRAYAKAFILHFGKADDLWRHDKAMLAHKSDGCRESLRRCEECIRALWFLGKKSDMARRVANALTRALRALEACISNDSLQPTCSSNMGAEGLAEYGGEGSTLVI